MKKLLPLLLFALVHLPWAVAAETPNIVIVLVDDMGYGDLGVYNPNAQTTTPRLDALAASGIRFTDAHTNSAVCTPTRYGLLTGRYAWRTRLKSGVLDGSSRRLIDPARETLASLLKKQNYRTVSIGKWHLGMTDTDGLTNIYQNSTDAQRQLGTNDIGFDEWFGIPASLDHIPYTVVNNGNLVNMTDDTDSPAYSTWGNQPASPSPRFIRAGKIAPGFDFEKLSPRFETKAEEYITDHVANHGGQPFFLYNPLPGPHAPWVPDIDTTGLTPEQIYIAYIDQIDSHVGAILDRLEDPNNDGNTADSITDDTLFIFTSDNGADSKQFNEATSGHDINLDWRGQKADIHEAGHRVPFITKWPGRITPGISDETICITDLFATIADIVDQDYAIDAGEDSYSLSKLLLGEPFTSPIRGPVVHHSLNGMFAIREGDWKLIFGTGSGGFSNAAGEGSNTRTDNTPQRLYNLATNPAEQFAQNQLSAEAAIVADLHAKLDAIRDNPRSAPHSDLLDDDNDGMNNGFENLYGLDKDDPSDANIDGPDADGLTNLQEFMLGTNPTLADSDGDKRPDGVEDANQNGIVDAGESDPAQSDSDGDGVDDLIEAAFQADFNDSGDFPLPSVAGSSTCLILDEFDNGDPAAAAAGDNGGVEIVNNTVAIGHSLTEVGGLLTIGTGTASFANVGAASLTSIDFAGAPEGVRLTWEIDSLAASPRSNGLFLGFTTGTAFYRNVDNLGLIFFGKSQTQSLNGFSLVNNDRDSPLGLILDSGAALQLASLLDGFTAMLEITPDGFSYNLAGLKDTTGADTPFTASNSWAAAGLPANFYSTIGTDKRLLSSVQRDSSTTTSLTISKIKAEQIAPQPFELIGTLTSETGSPALALVWNSTAGETFTIERSTSLLNGDWVGIMADVPAAGSRTSFLYESSDLPPSPAGESRLFFRVRRQ